MFVIHQTLEAGCFMLLQENNDSLEGFFDVWGAKLVSPAGVTKPAATIAMAHASSNTARCGLKRLYGAYKRTINDGGGRAPCFMG